MNHVETIKKLIITITHSQNFHGCIIKGLAGWGKTTCVKEALKQLQAQYVSIGSYSTPLNLFNFLRDNNRKIVLLDDVSGIFTSSSAMAILKSSTWPEYSGNRLVKWGSSHMKPEKEEFIFTGKLIIVCNSFPKTLDAQAIYSRCLSWTLKFSKDQALKALFLASENEMFFKNTKLSKNIAEYLIQRVDDLETLNYRTLKMGYEIALYNQDWKELLSQMIPYRQKKDPLTTILNLDSKGLSVKNQRVEFEKITGLKRRSFYGIRKKLNLSRPYGNK